MYISALEWVNKLWCNYTVDYLTALKMNTVVTQSDTDECYKYNLDCKRQDTK